MSSGSAGAMLGARVSRRNFRIALASIVLLALALRLVCVEQYQAHDPLADRPVIDERSYDRWAREIATGEWLGREIFFQEPLYPYTLAAVYALAGEDPSTQRHAARIVQAFLGALTVLLAALLARELFGDVGALAAALFMALERAGVAFAPLLLKENLFLPVFAGLALALSATRRGRAPASWLLVGVLAGLGALLRGNVLVLAPCFLVWPIARALLEKQHLRGALQGSALFAAGLALVLAPVAARNWAVGGRWVLTTSGAGTNFFGGNNPDNPYGVAKEFDWVRGIPEHEAADWRREAERRTGRTLDATETSSFWLRESLRSIASRPREHLGIFWRKLRLTLGAYEVPDNHFIEWDARFVPLLRAPFLLGFAVVGTLGLAGLLLELARACSRRVRERATPGVLDLAALFLLYLATVVLTVTSDRARLPLVPLLAVFAGAWLVRALAARSRPRRAAGLIAATVLAACFVLWPVLPADARERDLDERDYNLAANLVLAGEDLALANTIADQLAARRPASPRIALLRADLAWRRARAVLDDPGADPAAVARAGFTVDAALAEVARTESSANATELHRARYLRGAILQYQGRFAEAEREYRAAAAFDPDNRDLAQRLALAIANRAMEGPGGEARVAALEEAEQILARLNSQATDAELARLLADVRRQIEVARGAQ